MQQPKNRVNERPVIKIIDWKKKKQRIVRSILTFFLMLSLESFNQRKFMEYTEEICEAMSWMEILIHFYHEPFDDFPLDLKVSHRLDRHQLILENRWQESFARITFFFTLFQRLDPKLYVILAQSGLRNSDFIYYFLNKLIFVLLSWTTASCSSLLYRRLHTERNTLLRLCCVWNNPQPLLSKIVKSRRLEYTGDGQHEL